MTLTLERDFHIVMNQLPAYQIPKSFTLKVIVRIDTPD